MSSSRKDYWHAAAVDFIAGASSKPAFWLLITLISMLVSGQVALLLGPDANWDLRNYHLYNAFSVIEGRFALDHNPAGLQSHINPTIDIFLTYPAFTCGTPGLATFLAGSAHGLNFVLIVALAMTLNASAASKAPLSVPIVAVVSAFLGMSGALATSELGTAFADLTTAVMVLGGLYLSIKSVPGSASVINWRLVMLAGLLAGSATGLKLTNGVYLVSLGLSIVFLSGMNWLRSSLTFFAGAAAGLAAMHGWWSWHLWQETGNPVFPFFNQIFESSLFPANGNFFDKRFAPQSLLQTLTYPLWFAWNNQTAEQKFFDLRFAIAYLLTLAWALKLARTRYKRREVINLTPEQRRLAIFVCFVVLSYLIWQTLFSIQRYAR